MSTPEIKISKEAAQLIVDEIKTDVSTYDYAEIVNGKKDDKPENEIVKNLTAQFEECLLAGVMLGLVEYNKADSYILQRLEKVIDGKETKTKELKFNVKEIDFGVMKQIEKSGDSEVDKILSAITYLTHKHIAVVTKLSRNDMHFATAIIKLFL